MRSSLLVADYILNRAAKAGRRLTPFQIIKLTFLAHGFYLAAAGRPLINDRIEAWKHGPVVPALYQILKRHGDRVVPSLQYCGTPVSNNTRDEFFHSAFTDIEREIIDLVVDEYGDWSVSELYQLCHEDGSPWAACYTGKYGVEIPDRIIQEYYKSEMNG